MNTTEPISIYYQNVRGLRTKSHEFLSSVLNCNYDIICITESWLNDSFYSCEFFDSRYEVFRCDRDPQASGSARGGGVLVAVRRELEPCSQPAWSAPPPADELWVSIPLRGRAAPAAPGAPPRGRCRSPLPLLLAYSMHVPSSR